MHTIDGFAHKGSRDCKVEPLHHVGEATNFVLEHQFKEGEEVLKFLSIAF